VSAPQSRIDPPRSARYIEAVLAIAERGGHVVLTWSPSRRGSKAERAKHVKLPFQRKWQSRPASGAEIRKHLAGGGYAGVMPASLGCAVIDVDEGDPQAVLDALGTEPLAVVRTRSASGRHVWVRLDPEADAGNRKWQLPDATAGDIRPRRGSVVLWGSGAAEVAGMLDRVDQAPIADLGRLPGRAPAPPTAGGGEQAEDPAGTRNDRLYRSVFRALAKGSEEGVERAIARARKSGLGEAEIRTTVQSARKSAAGRQAARRSQPAPKSESLTFAVANEWALRESLKALRTGLRRNTLSWQIEVREREGAWRELDEDADYALQELVAATHRLERADGDSAPLAYSAYAWKRARGAIISRSRADPSQEWIRSLPPWDGEPRISGLLERFFSLDLGDTRETEANRLLAEWTAKYMTIGLVQRILSPGCELAEIPLLIGPQRMGKSALVRLLIPPDREMAWHTDGLKWLLRPDERIEVIQGCVVVEASEMVGLRRAELEGVKSFISRRADRTRIPYETHARTMPRHCIIIGTTNDPHCLPNDPSGNLRFVPVTVNRKSDWTEITEWMGTHREQLLSEARSRLEAGERANFTRDLWDAHSLQAEAARSADRALADRLAQLGREYSGETRNRGLLIGALAKACGLIHHEDASARLPKSEEVRLAREAVMTGWTKRRERRRGIEGRLTYWYAPGPRPDAIETEDGEVVLIDSHPLEGSL